MKDLILLQDFNSSILEIWKPIEGYMGYDVSSIGRVRSHWQTVTRGKGNGRGFKRVWRDTPVILKQGTSQGKRSSGYKVAYLYLGNHKKHSRFVHRLVAQAFLGNHKDKLEVNHKNGIKADNRVDNLEWVTRTQNQHHAWDAGLITSSHLKLKGDNCRVHASLDADKVREIRNAFKDGERVKYLAERFNVHQSTISKIVHGKRWERII